MGKSIQKDTAFLNVNFTQLFLTLPFTDCVHGMDHHHLKTLPMTHMLVPLDTVTTAADTVHEEHRKQSLLSPSPLFATAAAAEYVTEGKAGWEEEGGRSAPQVV